MSSFDEIVITKIYSSLYDKSAICRNDIVNNYPTFLDDVKQAIWMQKWCKRNNIKSDNDIIAHGYSMMILMYLLLGYNNL